MLSGSKLLLACAFLAAATVAGCGSSGGSSGPSSAGSGGASHTSSAAPTAAPGALSADAHSAATGDIPDNQVFLVFHDPGAAAGYSMKYPEGWTQIGTGPNVTFKDKNNLVHVTITRGPAPTPASVAAQLAALKHSHPTLAFHPPATVSLGPSPAIKAVYTTESAQNPVTGKRVLLIVDRYELSHAGKVAVVDLGTPKGVDNVDAYKLMIRSFAWR